MNEVTYEIQVWNEYEEGQWHTLWTARGDSATIAEINNTLARYRKAQPMNTFRITKFEVIG
jgi:hypothetical protein